MVNSAAAVGSTVGAGIDQNWGGMVGNAAGAASNYVNDQNVANMVAGYGNAVGNGMT